MNALSHTLTPPSPGLGMPTVRRADGLTPVQRRVGVGAIVALHVAGVWGLLQVGEVREAAREAAPMFFDLIAPAAPPMPAPPPPIAPPTPLPPQRKRPTPPAPPLVAAPSAAPAAVVAPAPLPEPPAPPAPAAPAPAVEVATAPQPPAPASAAAPAPRTIPPSAVQYLVEPAPDYPRASIRNRETGRVMVRLFIDEAGVPSRAAVERSSGFPRLDDAALAAVARSRFKPPTVDGRPVSGWTLSPIDFFLEK